MDSRRGGTVIMVMIVLLAIIWISLSHFKTTPESTSAPKTLVAGTPVHAFSVTVQHSAEGNMHSYIGEIALPSPCYTLGASAIMAYTKPPALTLQLTSTTSESVCSQEITKEPFLVSVSSEALPSVAVTLDGVQGNAIIIEK